MPRLFRIGYDYMDITVTCTDELSGCHGLERIIVPDRSESKIVAKTL